MSVLSSGDEYTEDELLRVCEEVGLPVDPESISILKKVIDELVTESVGESEDGQLDSSLFGSLSLSENIQSSESSNMYNHEGISSPIRRLCKPSLRSNYHSIYQTKEVPLDVPLSQENEEMKRHNPTAYFLLNDAWRCLNNVYSTMKAVDELQTKLSSAACSNVANIKYRTNGDTDFLEDANYDKENRGGRKDVCGTAKSHHCPKFLKPFGRLRRSSETVSREPPKEVIQPDPSLRRVDHVVPGQLFYKHDPVKKFELYREEWARRPAPGEQKRLALRWKVREYMLRQELASFDPRRQIARYTCHPKDWSPRPYLD